MSKTRKRPETAAPQDHYAGAIQSVEFVTSLSAKDMEHIAKSLRDDDLDEQIDSLASMLSMPEKIEHTFQYTVGYPNKEAAINGIRCYADGTVRKKGEEFNQMLDSFLAGPTFFRDQSSTTTPTKEKKSNPEADETLAMLEQTAQFYIKLVASRPTLQNQLSVITAVRDERSRPAPGKR